MKPGGRDNTIKIWNSCDGQLLVTLLTGDPIHCVAFASGGTKIISGDNDSIKIWDTSTYELLNTMSKSLFGPSHFAILDDNLVYMSWEDNNHHINI
jgi:WD40 repeat protein